MSDDRVRIQWENFMLRLKDEAQRTSRSTLSNNKSDGVAVVSVHVLMDSSGTPMLWVVPPAKRVEPSKDAASILAKLIGEFSDGRE